MIRHLLGEFLSDICSDIEDKYVKKLERMGTTGSGPARPFHDKKDYNPDVSFQFDSVRS